MQIEQRHHGMIESGLELVGDCCQAVDFCLRNAVSFDTLIQSRRY